MSTRRVNSRIINNLSCGPESSSGNPNGGDGDDHDHEDAAGTGVLLKSSTKTRKPSMYKVLLINDDYTPMEFVIHILQRFFRMTVDEATEVMMHVHQKGVGVCGVFTFEVAETKVNQVLSFASQNEHPLQCTLEKD